MVGELGVAASRHVPKANTPAMKTTLPISNGIFCERGAGTSSAATVEANRKIVKLMPQMPVAEAICSIGRKFICE